MVRIVVVEDEEALREEIVYSLNLSGFEAAGVGDGVALDRHLESVGCDIVVLDVGLPGEDGFSIAARLHATQHIGIIMLTAHGQVGDRVRGLKTGADVYLVKPVDMLELAATAESLFRRIAPPAQVASDEAVWVIDPIKWELHSPAGETMALTSSQYRFIAKLAETPGELVPRKEIVTALGHDYTYFDYHRLDSLMTRLRCKCETKLGVPLPIKTVHAIGYAFTAPLTASQPVRGDEQNSPLIG